MAVQKVWQDSELTASKLAEVNKLRNRGYAVVVVGRNKAIKLVNLKGGLNQYMHDDVKPKVRTKPPTE